VDILLGEIAALAEVRRVGGTSDLERRTDRHIRLLLLSAPGAVLVTGDETLRTSLPSGVQAFSPRAFLRRLG